MNKVDLFYYFTLSYMLIFGFEYVSFLIYWGQNILIIMLSNLKIEVLHQHLSKAKPKLTARNSEILCHIVAKLRLRLRFFLELILPTSANILKLRYM